MNIVWTIMVTASSVVVGTCLCFWLLGKTREVDSTVWILEQVVCPIIRVIVLLIVVSQIYPVIDESSDSLDFWKILSQQGQLNDLINILFFAGLVLAFVPIVNHPIISLPLQSLLTIALVFSWQYQEAMDSIELFPSIATMIKIIAYMVLIYFVTRATSIHISRWVDKRFSVSGSIQLVSDAIYLVLQVPVMLIYCSSLKVQLT